MKKGQRIQAANDTLDVFKRGSYTWENQCINIQEEHAYTLSHTDLLTPDVSDVYVKNAKQKYYTSCVYEVHEKTTVAASYDLRKNTTSAIGILNFASAKNAGGGFLNGAVAQEESLAVVSNLYLSQITKPAYYEANRACKTMMYTDHAIYAKEILFIKNDDLNYIEVQKANVLTMPAVNLGQVKLKGEDAQKAQEVMKARMRKVLAIFAHYENKVLILGAYGCGVFRNDPQTIAQQWYDLLEEEGWKYNFEKIVFAIYDRTKTQDTLHAFTSVFNK